MSSAASIAEHLYKLIILAFVVEAIVTYTKQVVIDKKVQWFVILAMGLGILVCYAFEVDFFTAFGMHSRVIFLTYVLSGLLISRGAGVLFDLIEKIGEIKSKESAIIQNIEHFHTAED